MSLSGQLYEEAASMAERPRWALSPSASRAEVIDQALRDRLAGSLAYLCEIGSLGDSRALEHRFETAAVSPWVFCLYSKLVAELARDARLQSAEVFNAVTRAAEYPAAEGVVAYLAATVDNAWWDHFGLLFDTDPKRPFKPRACSAEHFALCKQEIEEAFALMQRADPAFHDEVRHLLRMIVLGAPESPNLDHLFNGASTFFLWGATLLNADLRRTNVSLIDLLVHESSHVLLFGIAADSALMHNSGEERYSSPLRADPRPIDGIFHACFVATRVHLVMSRLLESGVLTAEQTEQALHRRDHNGNAARVSLGVLDKHARLTELGENVLDTIRSYLEESKEPA
jgi:HEXXH motif-containing protein